MDLEGLFHSPGNQLAAFAQMQSHLYRHDESLQDYFLALQSGTLAVPSLSSANQGPGSGLIESAIHSVGTVSRLGRRQKIKADVLFCPVPYFERKTENQFLVRTLLGLAQTGASILCLLTDGSPCREEIDSRLESAGRKGLVTFLDPVSALSSIDRRLLSISGRVRARTALEEIVQILEPHGLSPGAEVKGDLNRAAYFVEAWGHLAPQLEFNAVVARCHWNVLCSPVCRTARQRGKPVITFQQGVIGHTLDAPLTASSYIAFGPTSASFMSKLNARFFQTVRKPVPQVDYISAGSFFDTLIDLPDQFDQQTLLLVDVPAPPHDFYGVASEAEALLQLARKLLEAKLPLRRLIIRPHPYWNNLDLEDCKRLVREYPTRCELSHPAWSLEDDLRRSSVVAGIFSGVLTVASACGLPSVFLQTEQGYSAGDLACFSPKQTLLPADSFSEITKLLTDRQAYAEGRSEALRNAREYYADGANLDLSGAFFERILRVGTTN